ncbi:MAG TPA: hypothetical protein VIF57_12685 [Polyangia bacterium]
MSGTKLGLERAATGLVVANILVIGVVIACLFVARRAWDRRDDALAALSEARAAADAAPALVRGQPLRATAHAPVRRLRASTMDRLLLFGILGAAGSAYFTWLLVRRSRGTARVGLTSAGRRRARGA